MHKIQQKDDIQLKEVEKPRLKNNDKAEAFAELERGIYAALETYSNVHRGNGHNSLVTTYLFEQAREIVLEYMEMSKSKYVVIFCTSRREAALKALLKPGSYHSVSSHDIGLSLGVWALVVDRKKLPAGAPFQTGGGTTRLIDPDWIVWADGPDKFEAGTPAIVNIITFAKALRMNQQSGKNIFLDQVTEKLTATEIIYHDELEKSSGRELLNELKKTLIGRSILVPTAEGMRPFINLDNSASTPTFIPIWNAFRQAWRQPQQIKQEIINEVRNICAEVLGASLNTYDVIFTSNTTEAINLAAESMNHETEDGIGHVVLNTFLEHSSNDLPWRLVPGYSMIRLSVDSEGFVEFNELETFLNEYNEKGLHGKKRIRLVAISGASNVLGICNNLRKICRIVHKYGARLLVDAAQLIAHRKVQIEECGIDYLAFSAHKVYAPFGCGVLVVRKGLLNFSPAVMELIRSSGEENAGGIAALGKALVLLNRIGMDLIREEEQALTGRLLRGLSQIDGLKMFGVSDPDSPRFADKLGVIVFNLKSIMASRVAKELALRHGIGVRYGCHCAHILIKRILYVGPFLARFQRVMVTLFPKLRLPGVVRVSLGIENKVEDVDTLIQVLSQIEGKKPILAKLATEQALNDFVNNASLRVYSQL